MAERVLSYEEAAAEVLAHARLLKASGEKSVRLEEARGRVLAREVCADRDQPPFARSTRDGFAVRAADVDSGRRVIGSVRAGEQWSGTNLKRGEAIEIMTGAPLPAGADAVLMVEHAEREGEMLTPQTGSALRVGENVVPRGAEATAGSIVLPAGRRLGAAEIGVAASVGCAMLPVTRKPFVAIITTGDELVELDGTPEAWQIRNSNAHSLAAQVAEAGGVPQRFPVARDTLDDLRRSLEEARAFDLILLSGGVSMGKYDLVEQALAEQGAAFVFTGALIQPGKPVVFGNLPARKQADGSQQAERYFFGLPGNPISTQVCFHLFVAPVLRALAGRTDLAPHFAEARLAAPVKGGVRVTRFLPAELTSDWKRTEVRVVDWQGSGDVTANARGNCYAVLPAGVESFAEGETIRVLLR